MEPTHLVWNVGREIVSIGPLTLRWYGVLFALGFLFGYFIVTGMYRREGKPETDLDKLLIYMLVGTVVGARLGHCFFYEPGYYLSHPFEILKVWQGGLASHGGAIGILTSLYLFTRKRPDQPYLWLLDRIAVPTALGGFFIRMGNLFNSEILGKASDVPWAIIFPNSHLSPEQAALPRHPAQLYESISYLLIFLVLFFLYKKLGAKTPRGMLVGLFFVLIFTARFFIEFVKLRQAAFGEGLPLTMGQLLSIPVILGGLVLLWRAVRKS